MAMLVFSMVALRQSMAALSVNALLEVVALMTAQRLDILLPMTILIACVWTYGRAQADGEITAMRGAGIGLWSIILPALVLGAIGCVLLAGLQDEIIPNSHYRQRVIGKRFLADNIEALLENRSQSIEDKRFKCLWSEIGIDDEGFRVLRDVVVVRHAADGSNAEMTWARVASPRLDPAAGVLELELEGVVRGGDLSSEEMTVSLDLRSLSDDAIPRRRTANLSYEELLTRADRYPHEKKGRNAAATFHRRGANSFAAVLFALLGAPLGLVFRIRNRALIFLNGFLLVLLFHFGPMAVGQSLAQAGTVPAWTLWLGPLLLFAVALFFVGKARDR